MTRIAIYTGLVAGALLTQLTVLDPLPFPGGAAPNVVLLVVAAIGLTAGPLAGAGTGFAAGLALDLAPPASHPVGAYALAFCLVGYVCGRVVVAAADSAVLPVAVVAVGALGGGLLYTSVSATFGVAGVTWAAAWHVLPASTLYDAALSPFVLSVVAGLTWRAGQVAAGRSGWATRAPGTVAARASRGRPARGWRPAGRVTGGPPIRDRYRGAWRVGRAPGLSAVRFRAMGTRAAGARAGARAHAGVTPAWMARGDGCRGWARLPGGPSLGLGARRQPGWRGLGGSRHPGMSASRYRGGGLRGGRPGSGDLAGWRAQPPSIRFRSRRSGPSPAALTPSRPARFGPSRRGQGRTRAPRWPTATSGTPGARQPGPGQQAPIGFGRARSAGRWPRGGMPAGASRSARPGRGQTARIRFGRGLSTAGGAVARRNAGGHGGGRRIRFGRGPGMVARSAGGRGAGVADVGSLRIRFGRGRGAGGRVGGGFGGGLGWAGLGPRRIRFGWTARRGPRPVGRGGWIGCRVATDAALLPRGSARGGRIRFGRGSSAATRGSDGSARIRFAPVRPDRRGHGARTGLGGCAGTWARQPVGAADVGGSRIRFGSGRVGGIRPAGRGTRIRFGSGGRKGMRPTSGGGLGGGAKMRFGRGAGAVVRRVGSGGSGNSGGAWVRFGAGGRARGGRIRFGSGGGGGVRPVGWGGVGGGAWMRFGAGGRPGRADRRSARRIGQPGSVRRTVRMGRRAGLRRARWLGISRSAPIMLRKRTVWQRLLGRRLLGRRILRHRAGITSGYRGAGGLGGGRRPRFRRHRGLLVAARLCGVRLGAGRPAIWRTTGRRLGGVR